MTERCCARCGFLALRTTYTESLIGAPHSYRREGPDLTGGDCEHLPICFVAKANVGAECKSVLKNDVLAVIYRERPECDGFTELKPGYTPKEHQEMLDRQWMMDREDRLRREQRLHEWLTLALSLGGLIVSLVGLGIATYAVIQDKEPPPAPVVNLLLPRTADTAPAPQAGPSPSVYQKQLEPIVTREPDAPAPE